MRLLKRLTTNSYRGASHYLHIGLNAALPFIIVGFIRLKLLPLALLIVILSKWRTVAVKIRYWWPNILANTVDMIVGLSTVLYINRASSLTTQLVYALLYALWLTLLKPQSGFNWVVAQAVVAESLGLSVIFSHQAISSAQRTYPEIIVVVGGFLIGFACARHVLSNIADALKESYAIFWGLVVAELAWLGDRWVLLYGGIAQVALIAGGLGYVAVELHKAAIRDSLTKQKRFLYFFFVTALLAIVIIFSDWKRYLY